MPSANQIARIYIGLTVVAISQKRKNIEGQNINTISSIFISMFNQQFLQSLLAVKCEEFCIKLLRVEKVCLLDGL